MKRSLLWLPAGVAGAFVLHFAVVSLFLSTPLFEWTLGLDPKETTVEVGHGWSIWPGYVHLRDARVHVQDSDIDLKIDLPRAKTRISLLKLFSRQVLLTDLHVSGLSAKLVRRKRPRTPSSSAEPWKLRFENLTLAQIKLLQLDQWAYRGGAEIRGGFALTPGRLLEITPTRLTLAQGGQVEGMFPEIAGWVGITIRPFEISEESKAPIFPYLDIESQLKGQVSHLGWLKTVLSAAPGLELEEKPGPFEALVKVDHGVFKAGSRLWLESPEWKIQISPVTFVGRTRLDWNVSGSHSVMNVRLSDYSVKPRPRVSGPLLRMRAESQDLELGTLFKNLRFTIESLKPATVFVKEAGLTGEGQVRFKLGGRIDQKASHPVVLGDLDVHASDMQLRFVKKLVGPPLMPGWWIKLRLSGIRIRPDGESHRLGTGKLAVTFRDTYPIIEYLRQAHDLPGLIASVMGSETVSFDSRLEWTRGKLLFRNGELDLGPGRDVGGNFKVTSDMDGAWVARVWPVWVGIRVKDSKFEHKILPGPKWFEAQVKDVGVE